MCFYPQKMNVRKRQKKTLLIMGSYCTSNTARSCTYYYVLPFLFHLGQLLVYQENLRVISFSFNDADLFSLKAHFLLTSPSLSARSLSFESCSSLPPGHVTKLNQIVTYFITSKLLNSSLYFEIDLLFLSSCSCVSQPPPSNCFCSSLFLPCS